MTLTTHKLRWRLCAGLALAAASILVTHAAWGDMFGTALSDEESGHVLLAPLVFAYLAWVRRGRLQTCRPVGYWLGPLLMALGWAAWSHGFRHNQHTLWDGGAILMAIGGLVSLTGADVLLRFAPAFGALVFLIPVWPERRLQISGPLQVATARVTQNFCELLGMTVERQASSIIVNGVNISIVEACNGMRMVFTLLLVCYAYAFITPLRWSTRAVILAASPVTAIACNVLRLIPTVWVFSHASKRTAERFHDWSGWVMLVIAFALLAGLTRLLRWATAPVMQPIRETP